MSRQVIWHSSPKRLGNATPKITLDAVDIDQLVSFHRSNVGKETREYPFAPFGELVKGKMFQKEVDWMTLQKNMMVFEGSHHWTFPCEQQP